MTDRHETSSTAVAGEFPSLAAETTIYKSTTTKRDQLRERVSTPTHNAKEKSNL